ncbi:outer membrane protein assembly factor BamA [Parachitinimonas caeni]|uniref:Outer membrane protein assembly factor BamA n=1 Tax=Parachitinimonas caeni TaxID=3031301 RepID=A0ABT7DX28_9NEIS|nr:outer membrane protein assembly factor BamA [Parachitinimonas caeni]MDK2124623.1 outer membrane protein assembly factor BamA [Parachitinimonas caeni]
MTLKPSYLFIAAAFGVFTLPSWAFEPFVIKEIRVEGIQRTEAGTVFNYLPVKVGDRIDDGKASEAIKALFATGFYNDVRLEADKDTLVVSLDERPVIAEMRVDGAKEIENDQLLKVLREAGLAESRTFDRALLEQAEQEIKKQYFSRGKYSVKINVDVKRQERNRVGIYWTVSEGLTAKIRQINIVGNSNYSEKELLDYFQLTTPGWLTWFSKNDQYSKQKLQADTETLRSFYLNRGYLEFAIESQQVALSDDKKDIFLTININEGQKYKVSAVKFAGEMLVPEEELKKLVNISAGDVFSREQINAATERISARLADEGYAFSNVNAIPEIDKTKAEAAFTFYIDPGRKTYVRRVNVSGNIRTRDEVIRRELRQVEAAPYAGWKIKRSKERLDMLGYFSEVNIETPLAPESQDQVDVNVNVVERQTGNIVVGAGYQKGDGLVLSGSVEQSNIFGSGKYLKLELNTSKSQKVYALSFTDPYSTPDGVSRGYDIYQRTTDPSSEATARYKNRSTGGGIRWGIPISEYDGINFSLNADRSRLSLYPDSPRVIVDLYNKYGANYTTLSASASWVRDSRDSSLFPTRGVLRQINAQLALPGGDLRYYRLLGQQQYFQPISKDFTLLWNVEGGYGKGYGGQNLPGTANFYAGGVGSVRGYASSTLGPREGGKGDAVGGNRRLVTNLELLFPMPGLKNDKSVRLSGFIDGGTVWGEQDKFNFKDLRYSAGLALSWLAPIGPLKFSYAKPLNSKPEDKVERFQFSLGKIF